MKYASMPLLLRLLFGRRRAREAEEADRVFKESLRAAEEARQEIPTMRYRLQTLVDKVELKAAAVRTEPPPKW